MDNLQALLNGMSAQWQRERAETQMTLGKMIAAKRYKGADALVRQKLEKWQGKTALCWDWLTHNALK